MFFSYKLFLIYILKGLSKKFINLNFVLKKDRGILINTSLFYFLSLHFKLSSLFFSTQLIDIFSYEISNSSKNNNFLVYNFHNIFFNERFFIFVLFNSYNFYSKNYIQQDSLSIVSITELFQNANWLEREASELSGVFFFNKKDTRNLMLLYGDQSNPLKKQFPSIGYKELFYYYINDNIITSNVSVQF